MKASRSISIFIASVLLVAAFFIYISTNKIDHNKQAHVMVENCSKEINKLLCYEQYFKKIASKEDFAVSVKILKSLQMLDGDARQCHGLAHLIASTAVQENPKLWEDYISQTNNSDCAGGYLHGIIEGHISFNPDFKVNSESITDICSKQPGGLASVCSHGFGHVLLFQAEGNVTDAVLTCAKLDLLSGQCYNGVFMEDAFRDMLFEHGIVKEHNNPVSDPERFSEVKDLCFKFKTNVTASIACWANLGHIIADFYKHDKEKVYSACNESPNKDDRRSCYFRGISSLVISPEFSETDVALSLCDPYMDQKDTEVYDRCVAYIAASLVYQSSGYINNATGVCSKARDFSKESCFEAIGSVLSVKMSSEEKIEACKLIPDEYRETCLSASGEKNFFRAF